MVEKMKQRLILGITRGICFIYGMMNLCLRRPPERTITDDARKLLRAVGISPGSSVYAKLKVIKQIVSKSTRVQVGVDGSEAPGETPTLLFQGYRGYNIIYCQDHYYGWPWSAGGFTVTRFEMGIAPGAVQAPCPQDICSLIDAKLPPPSAGEAARPDWEVITKIEAAGRNISRFEENARRGAQVIDNQPTILIVSTAIGCNLRCKMCYLSSDHELSYGANKGTRQMSEETFGRVLDLLPKARDLIITVEGEILLHRKWVDRWIDLAGSYPNLRLSLQTNGMLLTDETVETIMACPAIHQVGISVDGATPAVNDAIRVGAKLEVVLDGIGRLLRAKQRLGRNEPNIHTHFVMMQENIHELPDYIRRMAELGVNSMGARHLIAYHKEQIADSLYFDQARCDEMILKAREVARQCGVMPDLPKTFAESAGLGLADRPKCLDPWRHGQILHDGSIFSCCNNAVVMGNINDEGGFDAVWNNDKYQQIRRTVNLPIPQFTLCKYCNAMLPVSLFEAHAYTKMLFELIRNGELEKYCPRPVELLVQPDEVVVQ